MMTNEVQEVKIDTLNKTAMKIILHAGDARLLIMESLDQAAVKDFRKAEKSLEEAHEKIKLAHQSQTEVIQKDASGDIFPHSLLFAHAQDTLMTIYSEYNIASKLLEIIQSIC